MDEPFRFVNGNYQEISDSAVSFIERYSQENTKNLKKKRLIPTSSRGINNTLGGGLFTQELVELVSSGHMHIGQLILHMLAHILHSDPTAEAVIISSNGSQNEETIYKVAYRYVRSQRKVIGLKDSVNVEDLVFNIMKRIFVIHCAELSQLSLILDELAQGRYKKRRSPKPTTDAAAAAQRPEESPEPLQEKLQNYKLLGSNAIAHMFGSDTGNEPKLAIVCIYLLSSMLEDSPSKDAWEKMPSICMKLRSVAVKSNVALIVANEHHDHANAAHNPEQDNHEFDTGSTRAVDWILSSSKWNSTVDKRLELLFNQAYRGANNVRAAVQLTKSKYSPVPQSCQLTLSDKGIFDESSYPI